MVPRFEKESDIQVEGMVNLANLREDQKVFMFLLDNSKSMAAERMFEKSKNALKMIIKKLHSDNLFKIVTFSQDADPMELGEIEQHESGDHIYQKTPKSEAEAI